MTLLKMLSYYLAQNGSMSLLYYKSELIGQNGIFIAILWLALESRWLFIATVARLKLCRVKQSPKKGKRKVFILRCLAPIFPSCNKDAEQHLSLMWDLESLQWRGTHSWSYWITYNLTLKTKQCKLDGHAVRGVISPCSCSPTSCWKVNSI